MKSNTVPLISSHGTLGGIVTSGGKRFLVTSGHVAVDTKNGAGRPGDTMVVVLPKSAGGFSTKAGFIAKLDYKEYGTPKPKVPPVSLDVALITPTQPVTFDIPGIGVPTGHTEPRKDMRVIHLGAETGKVIRGKVYLPPPSSMNGFHCTIGSCTLATDVFYVTWDSAKSISGDSGAFIVEEGTRKVVGIHKGATPAGTSFCVKASSIARKLGVSFVGSPGVFGGTTTPTSAPTTQVPTPIPTPQQPQDPIASLLQAILNFINSLLGGTRAV